MPLNEQLDLQQLLPDASLAYILEHRQLLSLRSEVIEHMLWRHYQQSVWSTSLLQELLAEYRRERFIALESVVIEAIKRNKLTEQQAALIIENMPNSEVKRQLLLWQMRIKIQAASSFNRAQAESLLQHRGYTLLIEALEAKLIANADLSLFKEPASNERDRKWKRQLYNKAQKY